MDPADEEMCPRCREFSIDRETIEGSLEVRAKLLQYAHAESARLSALVKRAIWWVGGLLLLVAFLMGYGTHAAYRIDALEHRVCTEAR